MLDRRSPLLGSLTVLGAVQVAGGLAILAAAAIIQRTAAPTVAAEALATAA